MVPVGPYLNWLEGGLRVAQMYNGRDEATMDRVITEAKRKHGSIMAAMRAGAI